MDLSRGLSSTSIQRGRDGTFLQSYHEQSISVINAMVSREWRREEDEDEDLGVQGKGTVMGSIFILMNTIMGGAVVLLPHAFGQIGIVTALIMNVFVVCIGYISHIILADMVDRYNGANYQELVGKMCGPTVKILSQLGLILYFFTIACATHINIGDQATKLCELADNITDPAIQEEHWYCDRHFLIPVLSMIFIFPLIWVRNISNFSYVSILSVFAVFYIVAAIVADYYKLSPVITEEIMFPDIGIMPIMQFLPVFLLAFQCHMTSVPLYYELNNRSVKRYSVVTLVTSFLVFCLYMLMGAFGLMTFGPSVNPDALLNYDANDGLMTVARACISAAVIGSYPVMAFLGRGAIDDTIVQIGERFGKQLERNTEARRVVILLMWHFIAIGIALATASIGKVLALVGSIAALFMLFFPGYMLWIDSKGGNWGYKIAGVILMFLGIFTFLWTIAFNVYELIKG